MEQVFTKDITPAQLQLLMRNAEAAGFKVTGLYHGLFMQSGNYVEQSVQHFIPVDDQPSELSIKVTTEKNVAKEIAKLAEDERKVVLVGEAWVASKLKKVIVSRA